MLDPITTAVLLPVLAVVLLILGFYLYTGAPPVPAKSREKRDVIALLTTADFGQRQHLYELGCGWGGLAIAIARAFPQAQVTGVELSPVPFVVSWIRALWVSNLQVRWSDFRRLDLSDADAVTAYLMIAPMKPLLQQLDRQLRPDTPVVTLTFWFRDRTAAETRKGPGLRGDVALYYWPAKVKG